MTKEELKNNYLRVSMSYIFQIQVDDKYLLIKSRRRESFQPLGGCYKFYPQAISFFEKSGIFWDETIQNEEQQFDFRIYVPKDKYLDFLEWFKLEKDRENTFDRELKEELFEESQYFNEREFGNTNIYKIKDGDISIWYSKHFDMDVVFCMDIIKLELTENQKNIIYNTLPNCDKKFILASKEEIENENIKITNSIYRIGDHTKRILI